MFTEICFIFVARDEFSVRIPDVFSAERCRKHRRRRIISEIQIEFRSVRQYDFSFAAERDFFRLKFGSYRYRLFKGVSVCVFARYLKSFYARVRNSERVRVYRKRSVCKRICRKLVISEHYARYFRQPHTRNGEFFADFERSFRRYCIEDKGYRQPVDSAARRYDFVRVVSTCKPDNRFCRYKAIFERIRRVTFRIIEPAARSE